MKKTGKIVYLVRHGQSEDNIRPVFQAPSSPLSKDGKRQAEIVANRLAKIDFETLVSSPFSRAKETAEIISRTTGRTPEYSDLFVERIKPSSVNGKPHDDPEASQLVQEWEKSLFVSGLRAGDGENFDDLIERADKALRFLDDRPEKVLVVVTHGFFLRTLIARVLLGEHLTADNFKSFQSGATMENTGLSAIKQGKNSQWRLWIYNDHAHLG